MQTSLWRAEEAIKRTALENWKTKTTDQSTYHRKNGKAERWRCFFLQDHKHHKNNNRIPDDCVNHTKTLLRLKILPTFMKSW